MTSEISKKQERPERQGISGILHTLDRRTKSLQGFWNKFNNDWSWNNAAGLAYYLLLSIFPLVIALLAIIGLFLGQLDPVAYHDLTYQKIPHLFPAVNSSQSIIQPALRQLTKESGLLGIFAIVVAIFNGSRLFLFLETCFDLIYHVRPRGIIIQNVMAIAMVLLFVVLVPVMVLASSVPALVSSLLQKTLTSHIPGIDLLLSASGIASTCRHVGGTGNECIDLLLSASGIASGLIGAYILFQVIYMVIPNQKISFRHSWRGAIVAAVLLELYLVLFPLYVTTFFGSFAGALGLLILLIFFYYFALILFLGAEVNAYFAEGIRSTPNDIATMIHLVTSHLPTSEQDVKEQAAFDHKDEVPKEIRPRYDSDERKEK